MILSSSIIFLFNCFTFIIQKKLTFLSCLEKLYILYRKNKYLISILYISIKITSLTKINFIGSQSINSHKILSLWLFIAYISHHNKWEVIDLLLNYGWFALYWLFWSWSPTRLPPLPSPVNPVRQKSMSPMMLTLRLPSCAFLPILWF